ncbi:putative oligopeptide transporter, OPT family [Chitinophaga costaii]|uniref:Putative oligopeptide transporter, OPT family n=1 Tax=Chitinophaga costaii TaxID=1335309 RepID=A0A1C4DPW1_9BACT|nr:oligopeptide transporter, OPT family [Chitinophaga costaii]PUZ27732.1 oligopeptide transporter, OPT family [Chitinophaga costaii]SCC33399.1 putative oligopeptide transporter, OPT family [Chitinophaga costaii]
MADFKPFVTPESNMKEFTLKSILLGSLFGIIFGASTVYLALKAGLTVSASIPIAVIAITLGRRFFKTTILENNIIQTAGSAGETIAGGVAFTLPGFLFLSTGGDGDKYFNYLTILILSILGGFLGTLMMVPLRRSLIVKEHDNLPYPEGTACAAVLKAGEKGGNFARTAFWGLGFSVGYAFLQHVLHIISETPNWIVSQTNKYAPSMKIGGEITPEYMGVGYIIGPRISGVLVAGGVLAWCMLIPLLATLVPPDMIATQLTKLGYMANLTTAGGRNGWDPVNHTFSDYSGAVYNAYIRQIGAGAVAAGGFMTLLKTIPTIIASFRDSIKSLRDKDANATVARTDRDLSLKFVGWGCLALMVLMSVIPLIPGDSWFTRAIIGVLVVVFGAFFVTVSSRIVGLIGTSNNPISGMTIATIMATSLVFISAGWTGKVYEPMVLVVGGMICIAAANAGGTSQDLKTGYIVGATPLYQQIALLIGAIVSSVVIGYTVQVLDTPTGDLLAKGVTHAIGSEKFPAPQATLMATLIKGILGGHLDWQFIVAGAFVAVAIELCGLNALSFAVGLYLPLSTTLPIAVGGAIKGLVNYKAKKEGQQADDDELGQGNLFATGLVAGGAIAGVIVAFLSVGKTTGAIMDKLNGEAFLSNALGVPLYDIVGSLIFLAMGFILYRIARSRKLAASAASIDA